MATFIELASEGLRITGEHHKKEWNKVHRIYREYPRAVKIHGIDQAIRALENVASAMKFRTNPPHKAIDQTKVLQFAIISTANQKHLQDNPMMMPSCKEFALRLMTAMPDDPYLMGVFLYILVTEVIEDGKL